MDDRGEGRAGGADKDAHAKGAPAGPLEVGMEEDEEDGRGEGEDLAC